MSESAAQAAGIVWQWRRRDGGGEEARRRAAASARVRGFVGLAIGLAVAGALAWFGHRTMATVVAAIAGTIAALALVSPLGAYAAVARLLERFGRAVGVTLTWLLMGLVWILLFLPVGVLLRATGKLRLQKAYDARRASYWQPVPERAAGLDRYRRQF